jgi:hypothetical protein
VAPAVAAARGVLVMDDMHAGQSAVVGAWLTSCSALVQGEVLPCCTVHAAHAGGTTPGSARLECHHIQVHCALPNLVAMHLTPGVACCCCCCPRHHGALCALRVLHPGHGGSGAAALRPGGVDNRSSAAGDGEWKAGGQVKEACATVCKEEGIGSSFKCCHKLECVMLMLLLLGTSVPCHHKCHADVLC